MNTLFDILKKDRKGTFHWVETVNDIATAEARLRQLSSESSDEFVVCRHFLGQEMCLPRSGAPRILQDSEDRPRDV
jgi:hypothetical protein